MARWSTTMSAPRWSARALECASAKALGLCQTSSAGGAYSSRARAWADGDVRLRGPPLPGGHRRPLRRRWRRPAPSPPPRRPRRRWREVASGGTSISSVVSRISPSWSALVPIVKGRAVQRAKVPRQAGSRGGQVIRCETHGASADFRARGAPLGGARHHALSARDPEQRLSERACGTTVRLSICAGQRSKVGIERTGSGGRMFGGAIHVQEERPPVRERCPYRLRGSSDAPRRPWATPG